VRRFVPRCGVGLAPGVMGWRGRFCVQGRRARGAPSGERQAAGMPLLSQLNKAACFLFLGSGVGRERHGRAP